MKRDVSVDIGNENAYSRIRCQVNLFLGWIIINHSGNVTIYLFLIKLWIVSTLIKKGEKVLSLSPFKEYQEGKIIISPPLKSPSSKYDDLDKCIQKNIRLL